MAEVVAYDGYQQKAYVHDRFVDHYAALHPSSYTDHDNGVWHRETTVRPQAKTYPFGRPSISSPGVICDDQDCSQGRSMNSGVVMSTSTLSWEKGGELKHTVPPSFLKSSQRSIRRLPIERYSWSDQGPIVKITVPLPPPKYPQLCNPSSPAAPSCTVSFGPITVAVEVAQAVDDDVFVHELKLESLYADIVPHACSWLISGSSVCLDIVKVNAGISWSSLLGVEPDHLEVPVIENLANTQQPEVGPLNEMDYDEEDDEDLDDYEDSEDEWEDSGYQALQSFGARLNEFRESLRRRRE